MGPCFSKVSVLLHISTKVPSHITTFKKKKKNMIQCKMVCFVFLFFFCIVIPQTLVKRTPGTQREGSRNYLLLLLLLHHVTGATVPFILF